jgi:hypothetical protein
MYAPKGDFSGWSEQQEVVSTLPGTLPPGDAPLVILPKTQAEPIGGDHQKPINSFRILTD